MSESDTSSGSEGSDTGKKSERPEPLQYGYEQLSKGGGLTDGSYYKKRNNDDSSGSSSD